MLRTFRINLCYFLAEINTVQTDVILTSPFKMYLTHSSYVKHNNNNRDITKTTCQSIYWLLWHYTDLCTWYFIAKFLLHMLSGLCICWLLKFKVAASNLDYIVSVLFSLKSVIYPCRRMLKLYGVSTQCQMVGQANWIERMGRKTVLP